MHERVREALEQVLGNDYVLAIEACTEMQRLSRRLAIKESRRMVKLDKANRIEVLKSVGIID